MTIKDHENRIGGYPWAEKSDLDVAKHINLALLLHDGISEQNAGFDIVIGLNDSGLAQVARIIGEVRKAAASTSDEIQRLRREIEYLRHYGNKSCTAMADEALERGDMEA